MEAFNTIPLLANIASSVYGHHNSNSTIMCIGDGGGLVEFGCRLRTAEVHYR